MPSARLALLHDLFGNPALGSSSLAWSGLWQQTIDRRSLGRGASQLFRNFPTNGIGLRARRPLFARTAVRWGLGLAWLSLQPG